MTEILAGFHGLIAGGMRGIEMGLALGVCVVVLAAGLTTRRAGKRLL